MIRLFSAIIFVFSLMLSVVGYAAGFSPMLDIVPSSTTTVDVYPSGAPTALNYTVTNKSNEPAYQLVIHPGAGTNAKLVTTNVTNDTCTGQSLPFNGSSCSFTATIAGKGAVGTTTLAPQVCKSKGALCSVPVVANRVPVAIHVGSTSVSVVSGSSQSAAVATQFTSPLVVKVVDASNTPVVGATVTFTVPSSGASAAFAGGINTATTNTNGEASSPLLTANTAVGTYSVTAIAPGAVTSASFSLANTAGSGASITATSGSNQSATISTAFAAPLVATAKDAYGNPVAGVPITFTCNSVTGANGSAACATFSANPVTTNASGVASVSITANANATLSGSSYTITASSPSVTAATFSGFSNTTGTATTLSVESGSAQSAAVGAAFASPLVAKVVDAGGNPVSGVTVTFTPPSSGASGTFATANTAVTNSSGLATSTVFTANQVVGSYVVGASSGSLASVNFNLTNTLGSATLSVVSGDGQSAVVGTAFSAPLIVKVVNASSQPVAGVLVTFAAPVSGASGTFAGGVTTATTDASGEASAAAFTANYAVGAYSVTASVTGATGSPVSFGMTNTIGTGAVIAVSSGTPQTIAVGAASGSSLVAVVTKDTHPVQGVAVTFTPPGSGASGAFSTSDTVTTDASGLATANTFTANYYVGGPYSVTAAAVDVTGSATFTLENTLSNAVITASAGSAQSAGVGTTFTTPLSATVSTTGGAHTVQGVTVTFTAPSSGASGIFANSTVTTTAVSDSSGIATASAFTANFTPGSYVVTPSITETTSSVGTFSLTNTAVLPVVTSLSVTAGPSTGGTALVITGSNFTNASAVHFGTAAASSFSVTDAEHISVTSPASTGNTAGIIDVTVTTPSGTSATASGDQFTYQQYYTVTSSAGTGGTISPTPSAVVASGGSLTFTATPTAGPSAGVVGEWTVDGVAFPSCGTQTTCTLTSILTDQSIQVTFNSVLTVSEPSLMIVNRSFAAAQSGGSEQDYYGILTIHNATPIAVSGLNITTSTSSSNQMSTVPQSDNLLTTCGTSLAPNASCVQEFKTFMPLDSTTIVSIGATNAATVTVPTSAISVVPLAIPTDTSVGMTLVQGCTDSVNDGGLLQITNNAVTTFTVPVDVTVSGGLTGAIVTSTATSPTSTDVYCGNLSNRGTQLAYGQYCLVRITPNSVLAGNTGTVTVTTPQAGVSTEIAAKVVLPNATEPSVSGIEYPFVWDASCNLLEATTQDIEPATIPDGFVNIAATCDETGVTTPGSVLVPPYHIADIGPSPAATAAAYGEFLAMNNASLPSPWALTANPYFSSNIFDEDAWSYDGSSSSTSSIQWNVSGTYGRCVHATVSDP